MKKGLVVFLLWKWSNRKRSQHVLFMTDGLTYAMNKLISTLAIIHRYNFKNDVPISELRTLIQKLWIESKTDKRFGELKKILVRRQNYYKMNFC